MRCWRKGRVALGALAAAALLAAACVVGPQAVQAANGAIVSSGLVYDDVYGVFGDRAIMAKKVGEVTDENGETQPVVQRDLVKADGTVLATTKSATDGYGNPIAEACSAYFISEGMFSQGDYLSIESPQSWDMEPQEGLMDWDGHVVIEPEYQFMSESEDGSYLACVSTDNGERVDIYAMPSGKLIDTLEYNDGLRSTDAYFKVDENGESYLQVSRHNRYEGSSTWLEHFYRVTQDGAVEYTREPEEYVYYYTSSTGVNFTVDSDYATGETVIRYDDGTEKKLDGSYSYASVTGDYVVASPMGGNAFVDVYRFTGDKVAPLSGSYSDVEQMHTENGTDELFLCSVDVDEQGLLGTYSVVDVNGAVKGNIPGEWREYAVTRAGDYVSTVAEDAISLYDIAGTLKLKVDNTTGTPFEYYNDYAAEWDHGVTVVINTPTKNDQGEVGSHATYYYYDNDLNLLRTGATLIDSGKYDKKTLPDGTELYVFDDDDGKSYYPVLDSSLKQVSFGGYDLAVPKHDTALIDHAYRSICVRVGDRDAYYARNAEGKFGIVTSKGEVLLPFEYDSIADYANDLRSSLICVKQGDSWYFVDTDKLSVRAPEPQITFTDVTDATPHAGDIRWLAENGISTGWDNGDGTYHFSGMSVVVRQDMAAFLHRLADFAGASLQEKVDLTFSDVTDSTPHAGDIRWLAATGVSTGWGNGDGTYHFSGMSGVTRQDMAAFLYRLAGSPDFEPAAEQKAKFTDVNESTPHAEEIWWLAANGVSTGWDDGNGTAHFSGMSTVVRQDMAAFLHRLYEKDLIK